MDTVQRQVIDWLATGEVGASSKSSPEEIAAAQAAGRRVYPATVTWQTGSGNAD